MATDLENLLARRSEIATKLANLGALDNPNATGSGHQIDRVGYRRSLLDELAQINRLINALGGPWEVMS
jgi:hypothetical protein